MNSRVIVVTLLLVVMGTATPAASRAGAVVGADYLTEFENDVLREQNLARTQPDLYSRYVAEWLEHYKGKIRTLPGHPRIQTAEGARGVVRAVRFLEAQQPLPPLGSSRGLSRAARDHVVDTGGKGWMGHFGSDDSEPADRISRYGTWYGRVGENITYGGSTARELVIRLIIDDGIPDRGHRANIFNPEFTLAGVSFGSHKSYDTMCVTTYAADFEEH